MEYNEYQRYSYFSSMSCHVIHGEHNNNFTTGSKFEHNCWRPLYDVSRKYVTSEFPGFR